jgi:hypothetical protein
MPTPTYTPLATVTLASATASVVFSSIPATYRDLILIVNGTENANQYIAVRYNSDTGSNYSYVRMTDGPASASGTESFGRLGVGDPTARFLVITQIMDYSATDKHKTWLSRSNIPANFVGAIAGRWANTGAITSVNVLTTTADTYAIGTTFSLYAVIS